MWIQHDRADLRPAAGEFLTTEYTGGGGHERGAMKPAFAVQLLENLLGAFSRIDHTKRLRLSVMPAKRALGEKPPIGRCPADTIQLPVFRAGTYGK